MLSFLDLVYGVYHNGQYQIFNYRSTLFMKQWIVYKEILLQVFVWNVQKDHF